MKTSTQHLPEGISLTVREPENGPSRPVIILCHGFCGIKELLLPDFADAFAKAGFVAVTFDYRGFGDSDGERGRLVPAMQIEDIRSVIKWVRARSDVDSTRIALWGTSLGAGHVFGAAAQDGGIRCVISQLGFADGEEVVTGHMSEVEKAAFVATLDKMAERQATTGKEMLVGITKVLNDAESKAFFEENREKHPKMDVKIPFLTVRETLNYKPALAAARVTCPTLVVIAGQDRVNPPAQGRALFDAVAADEKTLYQEPDARHYDVYSGEYFQRIIKIQIDWLRAQL
ncbi:alpha/beta hydrolase [Stenotrophomonas maltophilia]|uniref:UilS family quorum-quenching N-acyl-homoserine lactonase n=1 Tax=Stenotrophomonas maltophilia TaxID=40324 RepID=UPI000469E082|nr:alpha/beta hydrolase [Stenotrophomonas maltophilia]OMP40174.1 hypothetical protein BMR86_08705 [Stenotrophomonas sp. KAs 5-3]AIL10485.1 dienelactone hydrolase family protein [Stenotrophomonas maltophilia]OOD09710.1 alpha/beta hydrolase [Stenotrophomonas maltophilia]QQA85006.1 alpha/beta fold hydrolase [Stenotrophomonas maltophilia]WQE21869.1 alpha/beta hydrolase [Stenotrophomonas maltophilia]